MIENGVKKSKKLKDFISNIYFWLYLISKIGMIYATGQENWIALIGFTIATCVSYIEMMKL